MRLLAQTFFRKASNVRPPHSLWPPLGKNHAASFPYGTSRAQADIYPSNDDTLDVRANVRFLPHVVQCARPVLAQHSVNLVLLGGLIRGLAFSQHRCAQSSIVVPINHPPLSVSVSPHATPSTTFNISTKHTDTLYVIHMDNKSKPSVRRVLLLQTHVYTVTTTRLSGRHVHIYARIEHTYALRVGCVWFGSV